MNIIQVLLELGTLFLLFVYLVYFRSVLRDRVVALVIFTVAIVAILSPDLTTMVANMLGVGRGADLLIYIIAMGGVFALLLINYRLSTMEKAVTVLVRQMAIANARQPERPEDSK